VPVTSDQQVKLVTVATAATVAMQLPLNVSYAFPPPQC